MLDCWVEFSSTTTATPLPAMVPSNSTGLVVTKLDHTSLVSSVSAHLSELIRTNGFSDGESLPSERTLASSLSVSRGVVRSAIKELSEKGLLEARPNCRPVVRPPRTKSKTGRRHIGIWLWPSAGDYAGASLLKGIQGADLDSDVRLVVANASGGDWNSIFEAEARFLNSLAEDAEEAGAIMWYLGGERNLPALQRLRESDVPIVFLDRLPPADFSSDYVGTNNTSAAQIGVQHLLNLGHRRIAMLTNMDEASSVRERELGYRRAMRQAGITVQEGWIQVDSVDEPEGVELALNNLSDLSEPPTAVFCINDHLALQVYEALQSRNVSIPRDVSVLGFDGLLRWVPGGGYLTTMCQDFERMGQLAVDLVIERMTNGPPDAYRHLLLDAPLADNGSTAHPND